MNSYIFLLSCSSRDLILIIPSSSVSPRIQSKSANTYWATILYQASAWILRAQGQKRNFDLLQGASHLRGDEYTYIHNHNAHDMWYFWGMYKTEGPFVLGLRRCAEFSRRKGPHGQSEGGAEGGRSKSTEWCYDLNFVGYLHEVTYSPLAYTPVEICPLIFWCFPWHCN